MGTFMQKHSGIISHFHGLRLVPIPLPIKILRCATVEKQLSGTYSYDTSYAYDLLGNLTGVTTQAFSENGTLIFPSTITTQMTYDSLSRKRTITDPYTVMFYKVDSFLLECHSRIERWCESLRTVSGSKKGSSNRFSLRLPGCWQRPAAILRILIRSSFMLRTSEDIRRL